MYWFQVSHTIFVVKFTKCLSGLLVKEMAQFAIEILAIYHTYTSLLKCYTQQNQAYGSVIMHTQAAGKSGIRTHKHYVLQSFSPISIHHRFCERPPLQWRNNGRDGVSNHQPHDCLLNHSFSCRSKKTSEPSVTGLCEGNSPVTGEFPAQKVSYAEDVPIWWRHHV